MERERPSLPFVRADDASRWSFIHWRAAGFHFDLEGPVTTVAERIVKISKEEPKWEDFESILREYCQDIQNRGPWLFVGRTDSIQGWKLHLSSIPVQARNLIRKVAPILAEHSVSFKIAKDFATLEQLNEGLLGPTQIGKFMTIYPQSDAMSRFLAERLIEKTRDFSGPEIITDICLGRITYARYGAFNPVQARDRLGQLSFLIHDPEGGLEADEYQIPFLPPPGRSNPFRELIAEDSSTARGGRKLFAGRFLLVDVLKRHPKGSVFRGMDLGDPNDVKAIVLKEGRRHCSSDAFGRDMRHRLKYQQKVHQELSHLPFIARAYTYFEEAGHGYLALEYIPGQSLASLYQKPWDQCSSSRKDHLLCLFLQVVTKLKELHATGYIHRDLTTRNIWIGEDGRVYLLDFELAHAFDGREPPFALGTPGFMSPNQKRASSFSEPADDVYALGACLAFFLTGFDPSVLEHCGERHREEQLARLAGTASEPLRALVVGCLSPGGTDPVGLESIETALNACRERLKDMGERQKVLPPARFSDLDRILSQGLRALHHEAFLSLERRLWFSASLDQPNAVCHYRSASRGVSGVVYFLARMARSGFAEGINKSLVDRAVAWLHAEEPAADASLPGLFFGNAGIAMSVSEAMVAGLVTPFDGLDPWMDRLLSGTLDWPDLTHGAAGQGMAALICGERGGNGRWLHGAHLAARYLLEAQLEDGSWAFPEGVKGMEGSAYFGFAHGVAGIIYFLATYAERFGDARVDRSWRKAAAWLLANARAIDGKDRLEWCWSKDQPTVWNWWCHGAPGIALAFLRLYEATGETTWADAARKALVVPKNGWRGANLGLCHGIAGLGEIYLEAARVLGENRWREAAADIASILIALRGETRGVLSWMVEGRRPTADLMVGISGVLHFLLRFSKGGLGFPLLGESKDGSPSVHDSRSRAGDA